MDAILATQPSCGDWIVGLATSTLLFAYHTERRTGNVIWRTDDRGEKRLSLGGLKKFIVAPLHKKEMWNRELLDQNYAVTSLVITPIMAKISNLMRMGW